MAKKIYLSPSSQPANTYAVGKTNEQEQCRKIATVARDALIRCGFEVKCGLDGTMYTRVRESNLWKADAHIPIHTNAHNGKTMGFRGFYYKKNGEGHKLVEAIMDEVAPLTPGTSDGLSKQTFYELGSSTAPCAYLELGFHDAKKEAQYIIDHTQELGEAICKGVCNHYKVKYVAPKSAGKPATEDEKTTSKKTVYRVQVGSYSSKANAEKALKKLKEDGYEGTVVTAQI